MSEDAAKQRGRETPVLVADAAGRHKSAFLKAM